MNTTGTIITAGTQLQEPIYRLFMPKQDFKNYLINSYIVKFSEETPKIGGTLALLDLINLAEKKQWKGPKDLATNHNKYFIETLKKEAASKRNKK